MVTIYVREMIDEYCGSSKKGMQLARLIANNIYSKKCTEFKLDFGRVRVITSDFIKSFIMILLDEFGIDIFDSINFAQVKDHDVFKGLSNHYIELWKKGALNNESI